MTVKERSFKKTGKSLGSRKNPDTPERVSIHASDIMATQLITASPDTTVRDVAKLLDKEKIGAVPVVDHGSLVGIVSEGDLLRRGELGTAAISPDTTAGQAGADIEGTNGHYAKDVMTTDLKTVSKDTPLVKIVEIMQEKNIRRLLVISDGELVGLVARSNVVHALTERPKGASEPKQSDDDIIRYKVIDTLMDIPGTRPWLAEVDVSGGVVSLSGSVEDENSLGPSKEAIKAIEYVVAVEDHRSVFQPY